MKGKAPEGLLTFLEQREGHSGTGHEQRSDCDIDLKWRGM